MDESHRHYAAQKKTGTSYKLHLYEIQEWAKLIHSDKSRNSDYLRGLLMRKCKKKHSGLLEMSYVLV